MRIFGREGWGGREIQVSSMPGRGRPSLFGRPTLSFRNSVDRKSPHPPAPYSPRIRSTPDERGTIKGPNSRGEGEPVKVTFVVADLWRHFPMAPNALRPTELRCFNRHSPKIRNRPFSISQPPRFMKKDRFLIRRYRDKRRTLQK